MTRIGYGVGKMGYESYAGKKQFNVLRFKHVKRRGYDAERQLVDLLKRRGYWASRIPLSAVSVPLPDVIACKKDKGFLGFQVKSTSLSRYYISKKYLIPLVEWKRSFEAVAKTRTFIAVKFMGKGRGWRFQEVFDDKPIWVEYKAACETKH